MPYSKRISAPDIVNIAVRLIEAADGEGLSLRAIAISLGVKAPSLYRYYPNKDALEYAVIEHVLELMSAELQEAASAATPESRFKFTTEAYLRFAREHFPLYTFVMHRVPQTNTSVIAKIVWNLLLDAASSISNRADDTAAAVATWSFLHGYILLEQSGAFGGSGPQGGLELGLKAFLSSFRHHAEPVDGG